MARDCVNHEKGLCDAPQECSYHGEPCPLYRHSTQDSCYWYVARVRCPVCKSENFMDVPGYTSTGDEDSILVCMDCGHEW